MLAELLKRISANTLIYGLGGALQRFVGFLMIPVYTHYLSPRDYGTIELLDLTGYVLAMFLGLGLGSAVLRFYYDREDRAARNTVISTAVLFIVPANALAVMLLYLFSKPISRLVFGQDGYGTFFNLALLSLGFSILSGVLLSYIRAKQKALLYTLFSALQLTLGLSLNIYLIAGRRMGVLGSLYSSLISQMVIALLLLVLTIREVGLGFSLPDLKGMLRFGGPLIFAGLGMFVLNFADRFFLRKYASMSVVGTYALGYKLGMTLNALLLTPFYLFWSAHLYEVAEKENAKELFARVQEYLAMGLVFVALGLAMLGQDIVRIVAAPEYGAASGIVPLIALSYVFCGLHYYFQLGTSLAKQTKFRAYVVGASALLNILLNFLFIPRYGANGAAWATLLSFFVLAWLSHYSSQRFFPIPWHAGKFAVLMLAAGAIFGGSRMVRIPSLPLSVMVHVTLLGCFPLILWVTNVYNPEEKEMIRKALLLAADRLGVDIGRSPA